METTNITIKISQKCQINIKQFPIINQNIKNAWTRNENKIAKKHFTQYKFIVNIFL